MTSINEGEASTIADENGIQHETDPYEGFELSPFIGKIFNTEEDAKEFYNNFAYRRGFSIRKGSHYISSKLGVVTSILWVCSKEGHSKGDKEAQQAMENSTSQRTPQKEKAPTRTNCKAHLRIKFANDVWKVSAFEDDHNHPLFDSPAKKRNLRSHRSMGLEDRKVINNMRAQNIETAKIHEYLGVKHRGRKFLRFKKKDVKLVGMDVDTTLVHFHKKQEEDPEFYYDVEADESGRLKNVFWVDGRARRAFQVFGDVVSFDTTYQTNK